MALETAKANPGMDETRIRILIEKHLVAPEKNGQPKMPNYTFYAPTPRTDGRRVEASSRWTKPASKLSVQI